MLATLPHDPTSFTEGLQRDGTTLWEGTGLAGLSELRELRSLRHENSKLKQVVADLTLDRHILQEIVRKKL